MTNDLKREIFALPVLSLRDVIVYPHMVIPLFVGRKASIVALERAMESDKRIVLVAQKDPSVDNPKENDIYKVGTVATVLQMLKLPDGTLKVLVEGQNRCRLVEVKDDGSFIESSVEALACPEDVSEETGILVRSTKALFEQYVNLNKKIPVEVVSTLSDIDDADRLADTVVSHMTLPLDQKQMILELYQ